MTKIKISDLPKAININNHDDVLVLQDDVTKTISLEKIINSIPVPPGQDGINGEDGRDGREIELRKGISHIEWRYVGESRWNQLVDLNELKVQGDIGPQGLPGQDGVPGRDGAKGETGITPNIQIGTVTTIEPGQDANVVRKGTDENPIFDFFIPKGANGESSTSTESTNESGIKLLAEYVFNNNPEYNLINVYPETAELEFESHDFVKNDSLAFTPKSDYFYDAIYKEFITGSNKGIHVNEVNGNKIKFRCGTDPVNSLSSQGNENVNLDGIKVEKYNSERIKITGLEGYDHYKITFDGHTKTGDMYVSLLDSNADFVKNVKYYNGGYQGSIPLSSQAQHPTLRLFNGELFIDRIDECSWFMRAKLAAVQFDGRNVVRRNNDMNIVQIKHTSLDKLYGIGLGTPNHYWSMLNGLTVKVWGW